MTTPELSDPDSDQYAVLLVRIGSPWDEHRGLVYVAGTFGPYDRKKADAVASRSPDWARPHVMHLRKDADL